MSTTPGLSDIDLEAYTLPPDDGDGPPPDDVTPPPVVVVPPPPLDITKLSDIEKRQVAEAYLAAKQASTPQPPPAPDDANTGMFFGDDAYANNIANTILKTITANLSPQLQSIAAQVSAANPAIIESVANGIMRECPVEAEAVPYLKEAVSGLKPDQLSALGAEDKQMLADLANGRAARIRDLTTKHIEPTAPGNIVQIPADVAEQARGYEKITGKKPSKDLLREWGARI